MNKVRFARLRDRDWLAEQLLTLQRRAEDVAAELGCATGTVNQKARALGLPRRRRRPNKPRRRGAQADKLLCDRGWLEEQITQRGRRVADVAAELGYSVETVYAALRKFGLAVTARPVTTTETLQAAHPQLADRAALVERLGRRLTPDAIAAEFGCTPHNVIVALGWHGLRPLTFSELVAGAAEQPPVPDPQLLNDAAWLRQRRLVERLPLRRLAILTGTSCTTVTAALARHGVVQPAGHASVRNNTSPLLTDRAWLEEQFVTLGRGPREIAAEIGASREGVRYRLKVFGLWGKQRAEPAAAT